MLENVKAEISGIRGFPVMGMLLRRRATAMGFGGCHCYQTAFPLPRESVLLFSHHSTLPQLVPTSPHSTLHTSMLWLSFCSAQQFESYNYSSVFALKEILKLLQLHYHHCLYNKLV